MAAGQDQGPQALRGAGPARQLLGSFRGLPMSSSFQPATAPIHVSAFLCLLRR